MNELALASGDVPYETHVDVVWLARRIDGRRAADVHDAVADLIVSGTLAPGLRLPTIRDLARELHATPSVVSEAWAVLRREGLVETRRRGGTRVLSSLAHPEPGPDHGFAGWHTVEMLHAMPDVDLLPPTEHVFARAVDHTGSMIARPTISSDLRDAAEATWNFRAASFTAVTGGRLALELTLRAALGAAPGVVAVETPSMARNTTLAVGDEHRIIGLECDEAGPVPASLIHALESGASAFVYQPHGRIPVGSRLTDRRRDALANILRRLGPAAWVIEEDPVGPLFTGTSLGAAWPDRTVRLAQYWRAFGPDVDTVVIGGSAVLVDRIREEQRERGLRAGSVQQTALAALLTDPQTQQHVHAAHRRYRERQRALSEALRRHHAPVISSDDSLFACVSVDDPLHVTSELAALGIRVLGGHGGTADAGGFIRIATTQLPDEPDVVDDLASAIARVVRRPGVIDLE